jgi:hypothetical protein
MFIETCGNSDDRNLQSLLNCIHLSDFSGQVLKQLLQMASRILIDTNNRHAADDGCSTLLLFLLTAWAY